MAFFQVTELFGHWVIIAERGMTPALGFAYGVLVIAVMHMANSSQPEPDRQAWTSRR